MTCSEQMRADANITRPEVSWLDRVLLSRINRLKATSAEVTRYLRAYRNPIRIMYHYRHARYPFTVSLHSGTQVLIRGPRDLLVQSYEGRQKAAQSYVSGVESFESGVFSFSYHTGGRDIPVVLSGASSDGDLSLYFNGEYDWLPVKGKQVVDVGASIGDSAIYFALRGATKVIAFEPILASFTAACENISRNHLEGVIDLRRAAVGGRTGSVSLDDGISGSTGNRVVSSDRGTLVDVTSLDELVKSEGLTDSVMKVDCEGEEYDIISKARMETLRSFSHIILEYHYGYSTLCSKLSSCGFDVLRWGPVRLPPDTVGSPVRYVGTLKCERRDL